MHKVYHNARRLVYKLPKYVFLLLIVIFTYFSGSQVGYIHNLTNIKRSKNNHQWYEFEFQTSPSKVRRVVGFSVPHHAELQRFEESKSPIFLRNVIENKDPEEDDIVFNQQSVVQAAANCDVDFKFIPQLKQSNSPLQKQATDVDINEISKLIQNQKVHTTGRISLGSLEPKKVEVKSSHQVLKVKEDCLIEDKTGHVTIHIWGDLIEKLVHGKSYKLANLNIKTFQGKTYGTTTDIRGSKN